MGGLGSAPDTFTSPLGDDVPFDTIELQLSAEAALVSGAGMTLTSNGGGSHTLTLDTPVTPGTCQALSLDVRDTATGGVGTLSVTVCHQPLDINQDGRTNISDATAFGGVFNGSRSAALIDINGNGTVNIQDATAFGVQWQTWANTEVEPPK